MKLTKQLYPDGRAFKMPFASNFERLNKALIKSESRAYQDARSILDSALPDNDNFLEDDATAWEKRLGLITNSLVSLSDRKLAIRRKMNHPGEIPARQHYLYLESQLQASGFDVFVYENRFPDGFGGYFTKSTVDLGVPVDSVQHGDLQHGDFQHGGSYKNIIANYIDEGLDFNFNISPNLKCTFFIGGDPIGSFADVDAQRKDEFRQLILRVKPVENVGYLFINYI